MPNHVISNRKTFSILDSTFIKHLAPKTKILLKSTVISNRQSKLHHADMCRFDGGLSSQSFVPFLASKEKKIKENETETSVSFTRMTHKLSITRDELIVNTVSDMWHTAWLLHHLVQQLPSHNVPLFVFH